MNTKSKIFETKHFTIDQLDDGIYAVIHRHGGWATANAGIIDLGDSCLVFDTLLTVQAAEDLKQAAEYLTGKPVGLVINSHFHNDHIWGNQVFDSSAHIIASAETLHLMKTDGVKEYTYFKEISAPRLRELRSGLSNEPDAQPNLTNFWITYFESLVETFPILSVRYPDITFHDRLGIQGSDEEIELLAFKGGHTGCDTVLHIPAKGILFMSDLLFVGCHPYLVEGDPGKLLLILEEIDGLDPKIMVPGHGPLGTKKDLKRMKEYILVCDQIAREIAEQGKIESDIPHQPIPAQFADWILPNFYAANLGYFLNRYQSNRLKANSDS